jgi:hypothetical protein
MGQGFFVRASADGAVVAMNNEVRVHNGQFLKKSSGLTAESKGTPPITRVTISGVHGSDETLIYYNADAAGSFDNRYDAAKLFGSDQAPQLYTKKKENRVSIHSIYNPDDLDGLYIYLEAGTKAEYTLTFSHTFTEYENIVIKDLVTNRFIQPGKSYVLSAGPGDESKRFLLTMTTTPVEDIRSGNITVWSKNRTLFVSAPNFLSIKYIKLFNMYGAMAISSESAETDLSALVPGVYIVHVKTDIETVTTKIVVY